MAPHAHDLPIDDQIALISGRDTWRTHAVEDHGIRSVTLSDGPHGLRYQPEDGDNLGINASVPATCFPTAVAVRSHRSPRTL